MTILITVDGYRSGTTFKRVADEIMLAHGLDPNDVTEIAVDDNVVTVTQVLRRADGYSILIEGDEIRTKQTTFSHKVQWSQ